MPVSRDALDPTSLTCPVCDSAGFEASNICPRCGAEVHPGPLVCLRGALAEAPTSRQIDGGTSHWRPRFELLLEDDVRIQVHTSDRQTEVLHQGQVDPAALLERGAKVAVFGEVRASFTDPAGGLRAAPGRGVALQGQLLAVGSERDRLIDEAITQRLLTRRPAYITPPDDISVKRTSRGVVIALESVWRSRFSDKDRTPTWLTIILAVNVFPHILDAITRQIEWLPDLFGVLGVLTALAAGCWILSLCVDRPVIRIDAGHVWSGQRPLPWPRWLRCPTAAIARPKLGDDGIILLMNDGASRPLVNAQGITQRQVTFIKQVIKAAQRGGGWRPEEVKGPSRTARFAVGLLLGLTVALGLACIWLPWYPMVVHRQACLGGLTAARQCREVRAAMGDDLTWTFVGLNARRGEPETPVKLRVKGARARGTLYVDYSAAPGVALDLTRVELTWGRAGLHIDVLQCLKDQEAAPGSATKEQKPVR